MLICLLSHDSVARDALICASQDPERWSRGLSHGELATVN